MVDERAEEVARWSVRAWAIGMLVLLAIVVAGWLAIRAVSAAICADYNSISSDFCDEWHYDTPPQDAIPVPSGWQIVWQDLSCGSGGCPHRMYVLAPPSPTKDATADYALAARKFGWRAGSKGGDMRKDDLLISIEPASANVGVLMVPEKFGKPGHVFVSITICDEALACG
jgi:hypothetical protein